MSDFEFLKIINHQSAFIKHMSYVHVYCMVTIYPARRPLPNASTMEIAVCALYDTYSYAHNLLVLSNTTNITHVMQENISHACPWKGQSICTCSMCVVHTACTACAYCYRLLVNLIKLYMFTWRRKWIHNVCDRIGFYFYGYTLYCLYTA